ncbi:RagB/SusD family nutrient uptake outer membrane protein [Chitinophagaceae bacterium LB-8]|uniref:RagB/SusD family nutrient uptake outer membrane protein n=1 Tax=Paraflavisolibacter caeni TaxID=2982496 RepID=A0A9X2XX15_9BACT|nr:RagB/SusD family nutrient uptake outer membrane protein [Paraflavisolibacter caeni]MCU7550635.1 RagB/SusD family nutrient uptake outer membrane protein [Paraflavisolibacter caeni]
MKKVFLPIIAATVLFSSCKKELDQVPISSVATGNFYKTQNDFIQATNAVYNNLRGYPDRQLNLSETRSDNLYAVSDGGVRDWEGINSFHKTIASNPYVIEAYNSNINGVFKANELLQQLKDNGSSIVTDAALRTRMEAEARFLRAFYYFDLVRWFGKVPVVDHPVSSSEALTIPRSPVSEVYKLIMDDLVFAAGNLPAVNAAADKGKPTKWSAKGILALVHMTRSGPTYGIEGPGLGLNEWNEAYTLLNEIIASNRFSFLPKYMDIFSYTNENNAEVVFDIQYINGATPVLGSTFPWVLVPDTWFQSLGKPTQGGLTIRPISSDLVNSYEAGDSRDDSIIVRSYVYNGVTENRPFFKKYVDLTKVPTNNRIDWPINFIVQRYTDILMLKAECILHGAPGTQADVDAIVNQVRARAGLTTQLSGVTLPQLMEERRKEFAAEGSRWHDLVRSGLVETVIPAWIAKDDVQKVMKPFEKNFIIYPIPQAELDVKKGLYEQNPGY